MLKPEWDARKKYEEKFRTLGFFPEFEKRKEAKKISSLLSTTNVKMMGTLFENSIKMYKRRIFVKYDYSDLPEKKNETKNIFSFIKTKYILVKGLLRKLFIPKVFLGEEVQLQFSMLKKLLREKATRWDFFHLIIGGGVAYVLKFFIAYKLSMFLYDFFEPIFKVIIKFIREWRK